MRKHSCMLCLVCVAGLASWMPAAMAQTFPSDAEPIAAVPPATFASWFASGKPSLDGPVKPANSVTFPDSGNLDFYNWSEQMFLWVTSPVSHGSTDRILSSPLFFQVSEINAQGQRVLRPQKLGEVHRFATRAAQVGPNGLPVVLSKSGQLFEIVPHSNDDATRKLVLNAEGKSVPFDTFKLGAGRKGMFIDANGKAIEKARPIFPSGLTGNRFVKLVKTADETVFVDASGEVLDIGVGQAGGGGVLLAQPGSLVYYNTLFNDVMAYFLTLSRIGQTPNPDGTWPTNGKQFPTTQAELDKVVAFAKTQGVTLPDADALAVEVKASWVEADNLPNADEYITIVGIIPTYHQSAPWAWVVNGEKQTKLAMVGLHFVGSAKGHPELIWATFEHFGDTPLEAYQYNAKVGPNPKFVPRDTIGKWLFSESNAKAPFNALRQSVPQNAPLTILGVQQPGQPINNIGPSNVLRECPFGANFKVTPNPLVASTAESNTQIISINNSVRSQLVKGDVRANYYFVGSTWTIGGAAPTQAFPKGNVVGTSQMSNSTMETFQQTPPNNCFSCHITNTTLVSHVYTRLLPLPTKNP
jgi:hypothetical protein